MKKAWNVKSRNEQQEAALETLLDPSVDLVILEGIAGSGKTLLALAAGLEQVLETKMYNRIIFTRAPCPVGEDIGFLPGTEEEKMSPWMGALEDNLEMLMNTGSKSKFDREITASILETKIQIRAMQYMRGRSFNKTYLILDEVQNMTLGQIKVLLTRAGEDTKIVVLGDTNQVDNRKLNKDNNGLAHLIEKAGGQDFIKFVKLPVGERSRLATFAAEVL